MNYTHRAAAAIIADHWQSRTKIAHLPDDVRPPDLEQGYAIQAELPVALADPLVGWKIAATSERGQSHIGVEGPLAGRLFGRRVVEGGAAVPMDGNQMRVAECEFVFVLAKDLPPRETPYQRDEVLAAVAFLQPGLELPDSRFEDFASVGAAQLAADDACAHWMVVGPASGAEWRSVDLSAHRTCLRINGEIVTVGSGADVLGDPVTALRWIVNRHVLLGEGFKAGHLVTTGVTGRPCPIREGDRVEADLGIFGRVTTTLTD